MKKISIGDIEYAKISHPHLETAAKKVRDFLEYSPMLDWGGHREECKVIQASIVCGLVERDLEDLDLYVDAESLMVDIRASLNNIT